MELTMQEMQALHMEILRILANVCEKNGISYFLCGGNALGAIRHGGPIPWDYDMDILIPENQIDALRECLKPELAPKFDIDDYKIDQNSKHFFPRVTLTGYDSRVFHVDVFRLIGFPERLNKQRGMYKKAKWLRKLRRFKSRSANARTLSKSVIVRSLQLILRVIPMKLLFRSYDKLCSKYPYNEAPYAGYLAGRFGIRNMFPRKIFEEYAVVDYAGIPVRMVKDYDFYLTQLYGDYMKLPPREEQEKAMNRIYIIKEKNG